MITGSPRLTLACTAGTSRFFHINNMKKPDGYEDEQD